MSEQTPTPTAENTTRRAESAAEAIFGDKQTALVEASIPNSAGGEVIEAYEAAKETPKDVTAEAAGRAASMLAAHQEANAALTDVYASISDAAARGDWSQDRIDLARAEAERKLAVKK